jgi:PD-(D/E)XK nuclease superfamily
VPKRKTEARKNPREVSLHIGSSFAGALDSVVLPWIEAATETAFTQRELVAVVTPFASDAIFLRSKLLERGIALLAVKFLKPAQLREMIVQDGAPIPLREHLRLLLSIAAEECAGSPDVDLAAIAKSVAHAPDHLLREIDRLSAAGWSFGDVAPPALHTIAERFYGLVRQCEFQLVHAADRAAIEIATTTAPRLANLLVTGFGAAQWHLWSLLQATVLSAKRATVVLEYPREQTRASDEAWIGTWEEAFGAATPFSSARERARPFAELVRPTNALVNLADRNEPHFLVGFNTTQQAQAIAAMALKFLQNKSCTRLGILFPRAGALPRIVSELLARSGIPHNDAIGHLASSELENAPWSAWLELQENHQLGPLLRFLDANPESRGELSIQTLRDELQRAYRKILIDDFAVLRGYCARQTEGVGHSAIAKLLGKIKFLPPNTTLSRFLAETKTIFTELKWKNRWAEIERVSQNWNRALALEFPRAIYLRWLKEIVDPFAIARAREGDHPYSRVHLFSYAEADGNEWSHLILAGLNQGEWPQSENESAFLRDEEIVDLNARAMRRGKQGEGHAALRDGKTFLLSAQDRRQIALRRFISALDSTEKALAVTASLHQESAPERVWNPGELFSEIYFNARKTPLSQEMMSILQQRTRAWLDAQKLFERDYATNSDITQTRVAYNSRRRPDEPFGEYEFSLREAIDRQITLRATQWDRVVKTPALIWMKVYLGVESEEPNLNEWSTATGNWVHDWLAQISGAATQNVFVDLPPSGQLRERVAQSARRFQKQIVDVCRAAGRTAPDWWSSGWSNAFALADCLAGKLTEVDGWPRMATEWILKSPQGISLDGGELRLRGQIDLMLAQKRSDESQLGGANIWIVDYKTGNKKALTATGRTPEARFSTVRKKLVRGDAIQLGLYGLAARELGATEIKLSLLSPLTELEWPQLQLGDLTQQHQDFWHELYRMQETGIFGLRGLIRSEFSINADYPLATLPIDREFLQEKWTLTHPAFAEDEDDQS